MAQIHAVLSSANAPRVFLDQEIVVIAWDGNFLRCTVDVASELSDQLFEAAIGAQKIIDRTTAPTT